MRRLLIVMLACAALLLGGGTATAQEGSVRIDGGGFGHGVGMSQYGAFKLATNGAGANAILAHYYRDEDGRSATVENRDLPVLKVGLSTADSTTFVNRAASENALVLRRAATKDVVLTVPPGKTLQVSHQSAGTCRGSVGGKVKDAPCNDLQLVWSYQRPSETDLQGDPRTLVDMPRSEAHDLTLARGFVSFARPDDPDKHGNLHTRLFIWTQEYLFGLAEMPSSWPQAALRAQAAAGRTYALRARAAGLRHGCSCELVTTVADQHYVGWAKESEAEHGQDWVRAVLGSGDGLHRGAVVTWAGSLANTLYSSSNTGATEDSRDIFGGDVPYLRSHDDPHSEGSHNPLASWTRRPGYSTFASRLGFDRVSSMKITDWNRSGTPGTWRITGSADGSDRTTLMLGTEVRSALGLPSHAIDRLSITQPEIGDMLSGDFDGDGSGDVVAYQPATGDWIGARSDGSSSVLSTWGNFPTRSGWAAHVVGDFDRDGADDVASFNSHNGTWWVSRWDDSGFSYTRWHDIRTRDGWSHHLVGDFTGDDRQDIASYHAGTGSWWLMRSTGRGFESEHWATWTTRTGWANHLVGDLTGDGRDDIASFHRGTGRWWVSRAAGTAFSGSRWATYSPASGWGPHLVGDFDGDGRDDVVSFRSTSGEWWVGRSTGRALDPAVWGEYRTGSGWGQHLVGDFDGDARADVASYHPSNGTWWVNRSDGRGFSTSRWARYGTTTGWAPHLVEDLDGDGDHDLVGYHPRNRTLWAGLAETDHFIIQKRGTFR